ncbi:MAG: RNA polymerase sigma factor [Deltaproteobacteria bacterium]|nr:RNA polymerase sigma factor [Deltaproteobacteria bacterium]
MAASAKLRPVEETDAILVERVIKGDDRAFSTLYSRHARYIAGVIYGIIGHDEELDDLVQEVFTTAAEHLSGLREPAYFRTWLVKISIRHARRRSARLKRQRLMHFWASHEKETADDPRDRYLPMELVRAMDKVPQRLLLPWFLQRIEGRSLGEITEVSDASLATVKRRIAKAEKILRGKLDDA